MLEQLLCWYPSLWERQYLYEGFRYGFRISFQGVKSANTVSLKSTWGMMMVVRVKVEKEISEGRVLGPFPVPSSPPPSGVPTGVVPKKTPGEYQLIHHLTFPWGESVNNCIPNDL